MNEDAVILIIIVGAAAFLAMSDLSSGSSGSSVSSQSIADQALEILIPIIQNEEGFRATAYQDVGGTWTLGYGSTYNYAAGRPVQSGDTIDQATALSWAYEDANNAVNYVLSEVTVSLDANQVAALGDLVYNIGTGNFGGSTLLSVLNSGASMQTVAGYFSEWVYVKGVENEDLVSRRQMEENLFLS
jgi:lysozyme